MGQGVTHKAAHTLWYENELSFCDQTWTARADHRVGTCRSSRPKLASLLAGICKDANEDCGKRKVLLEPPIWAN